MKKLYVSLLLVAITAMANAQSKYPQFPYSRPSDKFVATFQSQVVGPGAPIVDPEFKVEAVEEYNGLELRKISYLVEAGERISGYLLLPKNYQGKKSPLIICLHPTTVFGKDMVIGKAKAKNSTEEILFARRAYALKLAQDGYICFAPDRPGYGERMPADVAKNATAIDGMNAYIQQFRKRHPKWGYNYGKIVNDVGRALDFLTTLPEIDAERIGAIGHSLGGWDAMFLYGLEPRIKAVVANSGGLHHFTSELWFDDQSRFDFLNNKLPVKAGNIDHAAQLMLLMGAPKPLLYIRSVREFAEQYDPNKNQAIDHVALITGYYEYLLPPGVRPQLVFSFHNQGHDFPEYEFAHASQWFRVALENPKRYRVVENLK